MDALSRFTQSVIHYLLGLHILLLAAAAFVLVTGGSADLDDHLRTLTKHRAVLFVISIGPAVATGTAWSEASRKNFKRIVRYTPGSGQFWPHAYEQYKGDGPGPYERVVILWDVDDTRFHWIDGKHTRAIFGASWALLVLATAFLCLALWGAGVLNCGTTTTAVLLSLVLCWFLASYSLQQMDEYYRRLQIIRDDIKSGEGRARQD